MYKKLLLQKVNLGLFLYCHKKYEICCTSPCNVTGFFQKINFLSTFLIQRVWKPLLFVLPYIDTQAAVT